MTTVSEVLNHLKAEGYTVDFNLQDNCLICHGNAMKLSPDEFQVDRHYRFEGQSDPGDEAVVYAISSTKHAVKGTLVNGYGISSEAMGADMVKALRENPATADANAGK
ncbi:MAG: phosphoribosylpyrophosphate synthetase [Bacteroidota bacterium]|nr:phosphoribosylpyrophosphate synthetase [Bacteroidota bacterium]